MAAPLVHPLGEEGVRPALSPDRPPRPGGIRTIVVPLDGSPFAEAALPPAAQLARPLGATLVLVQAAIPARVPGLDEPDVALQLGKTDARCSLAAAAASEAVAGLPLVRVVATGALAESPAEAILATARKWGADLVVMPTHGRTGVSRAVLGSVADAVVAASPVPVLLVHPERPNGGPNGPATDGATGAAPRGAGALRLLVALDGTPAAEAALAPVAALAVGLGAEVELARVLSEPDQPGPTGAAACYLAAAASRLQEAGVPTERLRTGVLCAAGQDVAGALLAHAAQTGAEMLVIATHARRGLARLVHGSIAATAVAHARLPVLIVRAGAAADQA